MFLFCLIKGDTVKKDPSLGDVNSPFGPCELVASESFTSSATDKNSFDPHPTSVRRNLLTSAREIFMSNNEKQSAPPHHHHHHFPFGLGAPVLPFVSFKEPPPPPPTRNLNKRRRKSSRVFHHLLVPFSSCIFFLDAMMKRTFNICVVCLTRLCESIPSRFIFSYYNNNQLGARS